MQRRWLNPFGSYYGRQLDYSHLGSNGVGTDFATLASGSLKPNAPSYNGQIERFSLLLAPYTSVEPPAAIQNDVATFFYPFGVVYLKTPDGIPAVVLDDIRKLVAQKKKEERLKGTDPLAVPSALFANPSDGAADLVWDPPDDQRINGYDIRWHRLGEPDWQIVTIPPGHRWRLDGLENGVEFAFQVRALAEGRQSGWTEPAACKPGLVREVPVTSSISGASVNTLLKVVYLGLVHLLETL